MSRSNVIPVLVTGAQFAGIGHLLYSYRFGNSHIPVAFIELNILAVLNVIVLIIAWFLYCKVKQKRKLWLVVTGLSVAVIVALAIVYMIMGLNKYG